MLRKLTDEFRTLRERIGQIIEECFRESEKSIREYMKTQEERLAVDLIKMR